MTTVRAPGLVVGLGFKTRTVILASVCAQVRGFAWLPNRANRFIVVHLAAPFCYFAGK
jgi:hypothetical protein